MSIRSALPAVAALLAVVAAVLTIGPVASRHATAGSAGAVTVQRVVDGDTVVVRAGGRSERVRLIGVDTPETVDPRKPVQCYGPEASAHTKERLAPGTRVTLEPDAEARDKYGRLLAYVYVGGVRYDDELLRLGYARLLIIPPNGVHARAMLRAALDARAARRGLWGGC